MQVKSVLQILLSFFSFISTAGLETTMKLFQVLGFCMIYGEI